MVRALYIDKFEEKIAKLLTVAWLLEVYSSHV